MMKLMSITYLYTNENDKVNLFFVLLSFMYEFAKNSKKSYETFTFSKLYLGKPREIVGVGDEEV